MKYFLQLALVIGLLTFGLANAFGADDVSVSAGFGGGNGSCGSFEPTAALRYDRDSDDTPMHFIMEVGPNGGCSDQAVNVDASVTKRYTINEGFYGFVAGGFDQRTLTVEFEPVPDEEDFKPFRGFHTETVSAIAGVGYDFGSGSVRVGYNAVETHLDDGTENGRKRNLPEIGFSWKLPFGLELDIDTNTKAHTLSVAYEEGNAVFFATATDGASKLFNDAAKWAEDHKKTIVSTPDPVYSFGIQWSF